MENPYLKELDKPSVKSETLPQIPHFKDSTKILMITYLASKFSTISEITISLDILKLNVIDLLSSLTPMKTVDFPTKSKYLIKF